MPTETKTVTRLNGLDLDALNDVVREVERDHRKGMVSFHVRSVWRGQTKSRSTVESYTIGGQEVRRHFDIDVDEPHELLGQNTAPNPQEMLMTALNACIMVGYVAGAAVKGITLQSVEIETDGELDLRGFLGIDPAVLPGYETLNYTVRIKGSGTKEEFAEVHKAVMATSPNFHNLSRPVDLKPTLVVE